jgi:hypothetical protein
LSGYPPGWCAGPGDGPALQTLAKSGTECADTRETPMNANGPDLFRAGALRLRALADGPDALHLLCEGDVSLPEWQPGDDPLAEFFGPGVYRCKLLLNLDRAGYLDTSGISWLIACHRRFEAAGGALVLHSIPPRARHVLALPHMDRVFHTAAGPEAARSLSPGGKP